MNANRRGAIAVVLFCAFLANTGCANEDPGQSNAGGVLADPGKPMTVAGAVEVLDAIAPSLIGGDGPRVCSLMSSDAQRRFERAVSASNCIQATAKSSSSLSDEDKELLSVADWDVAISGQRAEVSGDAGMVVARVIGASELVLVRIDERWAVS